jgi:hypothetical protein
MDSYDNFVNGEMKTGEEINLSPFALICFVKEKEKLKKPRGLSPGALGVARVAAVTEIWEVSPYY